VGTARTLPNTSCSDTFAQKTSQNRKLQRPADLCATRHRPSPTTAVAKAIDETSTPRLEGAPSQSPLLCGPLFAPAAHEEVAFFGEHRPGGIPSSSESPRHLIQATRSMKNNSVANLLPRNPRQRNQLPGVSQHQKPMLLLYKASKAPWQHRSARGHDGVAGGKIPQGHRRRRHDDPLRKPKPAEHLELLAHTTSSRSPSSARTPPTRWKRGQGHFISNSIDAATRTSPLGIPTLALPTLFTPPECISGVFTPSRRRSGRRREQGPEISSAGSGWRGSFSFRLLSRERGRGKERLQYPAFGG
jgi:hypothetical protein